MSNPADLAARIFSSNASDALSVRYFAMAFSCGVLGLNNALSDFSVVPVPVMISAFSLMILSSLVVPLAGANPTNGGLLIY